MPAANMNTLSPGMSGVTTMTHAFPKGVYSVRACADKSNRSNSGRVSESNEGNNCSSQWVRVVAKDPPEITSVSMNFPDITFICNNSETYSVTHVESRDVVGQGNTTDGEMITVKFSEEGNYSLLCISEPLTDSAGLSYTIPEMTQSGMSLNASPRTVNNNKNTSLSWSVLNPKAACSLRAEAVCFGGHSNCSAAQLAEESSLNSILTTGTTDASDPYGPNRNIQTAVRKVYTKYSNKALGKKTLIMRNTTDFILDCGTSRVDGTSLLKKVRVIVSDENEG